MWWVVFGVLGVGVGMLGSGGVFSCISDLSLFDGCGCGCVSW